VLRSPQRKAASWTDSRHAYCPPVARWETFDESNASDVQGWQPMKLKADLVAIVDDDAAIRRSIERLLRTCGYATTSFSSAEELLESEAVDDAVALVLDLHLEWGSGIDLVHRLKSANRRVPIVMVTGSDDAATRAEALSAGCFDYLQKPLDESVLLQAIERCRALSRSERVPCQGRG